MNIVKLIPNLISISFEAELVLFPVDPATHPTPGKVSMEAGEKSNKKELIQDHLRTTSIHISSPSHFITTLFKTTSCLQDFFATMLLPNISKPFQETSSSITQVLNMFTFDHLKTI